MERHVIKKQTAEQLFKNTFQDAISQIGESNVFYCGTKMYIKTNSVIISVEFIGTNTAFNNLVLTAMNTNGPIDKNITPLSMIFNESKGKSGQEKLVSLRVILNVTGEYTIMWSSELSDDDKMNLNNSLMNYIELFSNL